MSQPQGAAPPPEEDVPEEDVREEDLAAPAATGPPTRLVLVRHALTALTGPRLAGRSPGVDLTPQGVAQAEALADRLAALPVAAVYAGPLERTMQTAGPIAARHGLEVRPLPGVTEADYGEWTGAAIADLARTDTWKVVQVAPSRAAFPGGESLHEMQNRTVSTLEGLLAEHPSRTVVVVSHADPIKAAVAHFTGLHLDLFQRLHVSPASVTVLAFHRYGAVLVRCNDTGNLDDPLPDADRASASEPTDG